MELMTNQAVFIVSNFLLIFFLPGFYVSLYIKYRKLFNTNSNYCTISVQTNNAKNLAMFLAIGGFLFGYVGLFSYFNGFLTPFLVFFWELCAIGIVIFGLTVPANGLKKHTYSANWAVTLIFFLFYFVGFYFLGQSFYAGIILIIINTICVIGTVILKSKEQNVSYKTQTFINILISMWFMVYMITILVKLN